jgi:RNA polymerase sigma factor (sigma-70 family)
MISGIKFKYLASQHKDRIFSYALWMVKNRQDAEDITQEILLKIWEHAENVKKESFSAWVIRVTHNLSIDYIRKRKVRTKYEQPQYEDAPEPPDRDNPKSDILNLAHISLFDKKLTDALNELPELQRRALILYEIQGLKYREISEVLEIPINSVKVNIFRAREGLQKLLEKYKEDLI